MRRQQQQQQDGKLNGFPDTCPEKPRETQISPFVFAEELLCGALLYWPCPTQPVSLLLCGPSGNGKSHVVHRAVERARGATCHPVFAVTPHLAASLSRKHKDGTTALRKYIRQAICGTLVEYTNSQSDGTKDGDGAAVIIVLDHMEFFITASNGSAELMHADKLAPGQPNSKMPYHPALLADLFDILRGRELFNKEELRLMRLSTVLFVTLFNGAWEDIDPFARAKFFDAYVALKTPFLEERVLFFQTRTTAPPSLCRAIAARSGGISYRGLKEIVAHMENVMQDVMPVEDKFDVEAEEALAAVISLRVVQAFRASDSIVAKEYRKSAGYVDVQETHWNDIAGLESIKESLHRLVLRPLQFSAAYRRFGIRPSTGVLLCGPPGTGKTLLARAMATELNASFIYIDLPQLIQAEVGESERRLREFFDAARECSPSVMFIDELQAAFGARHDTQGGLGSTHDGRLVTQLLHLLDRAQEDEDHSTLFVGATNVRSMLDASLLRAGRLDTLLDVPLPDGVARRAMVRRAVCGEWAAWFPVDVEAAREALICAFVENTVGFSGAELRHAVNVFALQFVRLARVQTTSENDAFVQQLRELVIERETHKLGAFVQDALKRALAGATRL